MNNLQKLQEVQVQITEMIKSDYPKPIFRFCGGNRLEFQFDEMSYHGNLEIGVYDDDGLYMEADHGIECIGETFMESFKEVYKEEQRQLEIYVEQMHS